MPDPSHICDLHHGLWQRWILGPLSGTEPASSWKLVEFISAEPQWVLLRFILKITLFYNYVSSLCTTLYLHFCIPYSMLTIKNLVSIHHHTIEPFYSFHFPIPPYSVNHNSIPCIYVFVLFTYLVFLYSPYA